MSIVVARADDPAKHVPRDAIEIEEHDVPLEVRTCWRSIDEAVMGHAPPAHLDIIRRYFRTVDMSYVYYCGFNTVVRGEMSYTEFVIKGTK